MPCRACSPHQQLSHHFAAKQPFYVMIRQPPLQWHLFQSFERCKTYRTRVSLASRRVMKRFHVLHWPMAISSVKNCPTGVQSGVANTRIEIAISRHRYVAATCPMAGLSTTWEVTTTKPHPAQCKAVATGSKLYLQLHC
jgi:hypothetical protein